MRDVQVSVVQVGDALPRARPFPGAQVACLLGAYDGDFEGWQGCVEAVALAEQPAAQVAGACLGPDVPELLGEVGETLQQFVP